MSKLKISLLAIVSAAAMFGAASASAQSFQVWNGSAWVATGTSHLVGPTSATYLGNPVPCTADFTVQSTAGVGTVTAASFSGSTTCAGIVAQGLPWTITIGANSGSNWALTIGGSSTTTTAGGVNITLPAPLNAKCPSAAGRSPISGTFTNPAGTPPGAAAFVFNGTLGPCSVKSNPTIGTGTNPSIRIIP